MKNRIATFAFIIAACACTPGARVKAVEEAGKLAICVAENQDQPIEVVLVKCAAENVTPADIEKLFEAQKTATNRAAAKKAGCGKEGK